MKQLSRNIALLILVAASVRAEIVVPLPPFTVYGDAHNWNGRAFSSNDAATVVAKINGVVMDRCDVISGVYPALNYRVHIPMAGSPMAGHGAIGDTITFEVYYDGQTHSVCTGLTAFTVGQPASAARYDLFVGTDLDADGLPDEYESLLMPYYATAGRGSSLSDIAPGDDFDGDGFSNLQEFYAGTIPVLGTDFLEILSFGPLGNGYLALSFLAAPSRTYALPNSTHLVSGHWSAAGFAMTTNEPPARTFYTSEEDAYTTLYLQPTNNAAVRLEVK